MNPWLSVIMPVHNGARFLSESLESVANERPVGVEILIYDSSDAGESCCRIVEKFADRLAIRYLPTPDVKPWQSKVNLGAAEAEAPHIAILHQDDLWLEGHLEAAKRAISTSPEAAFSAGPSRFVEASGKDVGLWRLPLKPGLHASQVFLAKLIVQNTIAVPSPVIRRSAWQDCGGMDDRLWYTPDWDVYLKLARLGPVLVREGATTAFRLHNASLTMTGSADIEAFSQQLDTVLEAHSPFLSGDNRQRLIRIARTSITTNCALALASRGEYSALVNAAVAILKLGPVDAVRLVRDATLIDRIMARIHLLAQRKAAA